MINKAFKFLLQEVFMLPFNELIKNYDKIRSYLQDFSIYGYKTREDFTHKSSRTYDNERRRIQSYLNQYVSEQYALDGKRLSIHFNHLEIESNPFFETYKTKSFTKNDIRLHFILLDLLKSHQQLCVGEIVTLISDDYAAHFDCDALPDSRTIRLKLEEYVGLEILSSFKEGKQVYYRLVPSLLETLPSQTKDHLLDALGYFQNVAPLGLLGHFILERHNKPNHYFAFPDLHFTHSIDENIVLTLTEAIRGHHKVYLYYTDSHYVPALPLKIVDNVEQGRRYIMVYQYRVNKYKFFRIDKLAAASILKETDPTFNMKLSIANALLQNSWGVAINAVQDGAQLETWSLLLNIHETHEKHLLEELMAYTPNAILQHTGKHTYAYTFSLLEANEMTPWLRKLSGHILSIDCTNKMLQTRFINDIQNICRYYAVPSKEAFSLQDNPNTLYQPYKRSHSSKLTPQTASLNASSKKPTKQHAQKLPWLMSSHDLLHKLYSKYFTLAYLILKHCTHTTITLDEIRQIVTQYGFGESLTSFVPLMTSSTQEGYNLLAPQGHNAFTSILQNEPFTFLTKLEKEWLATLIEHPKITLFLTDEDLFYLKKALSTATPLYDANCFSYIQQNKAPNYYCAAYYQDYFKRLLTALKEQLCTSLTYTAPSSEAPSTTAVTAQQTLTIHAIPYKIEYHLKSDSFSLLAVTYEEDTLTSLIRIPLHTIQEVKLLEPHELSTALHPFIQAAKVKEPIIFQLSNKRSGFDRVFMALSNFERMTTFDKDTESCTVKLYYYPFDEDTIIETLISFGPVLKVLSPAPIVAKIKGRFDLQAQLFANFFSQTKG